MSKGTELFHESGAAAQSQKNAWTRLASTYGMIGVSLTDEKLTVRPKWYAGWLARLLGLDLHHEIPLARIDRVSRQGASFGYGRVEVRFRTASNEPGALLLFLRKHAEFMERLGSVLDGGTIQA